MINFKLNIKRI